MLMEWLYSVPFPSPSKEILWNYDNGTGSLLSNITNTIPEKFFKCESEKNLEVSEDEANEEDSKQDVIESEKSADPTSDIAANQHGSNKAILVYSIEPVETQDMFYIAFHSDELRQLIGTISPMEYGDDRILKHTLPHTTVKKIIVPSTQSEHCAGSVMTPS